MTAETEYAPLDIASHLDNEEVIAEYLTAAAEDENPDVLLIAMADVAKARGMAQVAQAAGLGRESLYKALAPGSHPRFETIRAVLRALGVKVVVRGQETAKAASRPVTIDDFVPIKRAKHESSSKAKTIAGRVVAKKGELAAKHAVKRAAARKRRA
jgi:probable addiction module antidote protein